MALIIDADGSRSARVPPPPPRNEADRRQMDAAIAKAERERAAADGPEETRTTEVPHQVQRGDTLTGISRIYGGDLPDVINANPQIGDPDLIRPGEVVFVPSRDPALLSTREQVAEAEAAEGAVASLEVMQRDPESTTAQRKLAGIELPEARANASRQWGEVQSAIQAELREAGAHTPFPDDAARELIAEIRGRAPESATFQDRVDVASQIVDREWRAQRTTRAQLAELVTGAREADQAVASLEQVASRIARLDLPDARREASARWNDVQGAIERELRYAGGDRPFPDEAAMPILELIRAQFPQDPKFLQAATEAYQTVEAAWAASTTTQAELDARVRDAQAGEHSLTVLEEMARSSASAPAERRLAQIELGDARATASERWSALRREFEAGIRVAGEGIPYPEEATASYVAALKAGLPDDPKLQDTVDEAVQNVTAERRAQGWTRDQLGTIADKYYNVREARQALDRARRDASQRVEVAELQSVLSTAQTSLRQEMEAQLRGAGDAVPPEQREAAITGRALIMAQHGPQENDFQDGVDQAHYDVVVQPGIDAVRIAYDSGGATRAAVELNGQTGGVLPETAERIVLGSMTTIDKITKDLGDGSVNFDHRNQVFQDLATAADRASNGNNGPQVVNTVADNAARNLMAGGYGEYIAPLLAGNAARQGEGVTLSTAMVRALNDQGHTEAAAATLAGVRDGVADLQSDIANAVEEFRSQTETIVRLRADWSGMMSAGQLDQATIAYVERHPETLENFNRTYAELERLGYAATRTLMALGDTALNDFSGTEGHQELVTTRDALADADDTTIVMTESAPARHEVICAVLTAETAQVEARGPLPGNSAGLANNARNSVKETGNSVMIVSSSAGAADAADSFGSSSVASREAGDVFSGRRVTLDPKKATNFGGAMNGLGAAFNGLAAYAAITKYTSGEGNIGDAVKGAYYAMGTAKETAELMAVFTARNWLGPLSVSARGQDAAASILAASKKGGTLRHLPSHLADQPGWVRFSTFLKFAGAAIDTGYAVHALRQEDYPAAGLYAASASGGALMALAGAGVIGSWGGPVGAGIAVLSAGGLWLYRDAQDKAKFEAPSREFLQAAGYDEDVAAALANYDNNDGQSAGPALAATARQFGVDPGALMEQLNRMPADQVEDLAGRAHTVNPNDQGAFPLTSDTDYQVWGPERKDPEYGGHYLYDPHDTRYRGGYAIVVGSSYPMHMTEPNPHSLTALRDYARALFGEPVLG